MSDFKNSRHNQGARQIKSSSRERGNSMQEPEQTTLTSTVQRMRRDSDSIEEQSPGVLLGNDLVLSESENQNY